MPQTLVTHGRGLVGGALNSSRSQSIASAETSENWMWGSSWWICDALGQLLLEDIGAPQIKVVFGRAKGKSRQVFGVRQWLGVFETYGPFVTHG